LLSWQRPPPDAGDHAALAQFAPAHEAQPARRSRHLRPEAEDFTARDDQAVEIARGHPQVLHLADLQRLLGGGLVRIERALRQCQPPPVRRDRHPRQPPRPAPGRIAQPALGPKAPSLADEQRGLPARRQRAFGLRRPCRLPSRSDTLLAHVVQLDHLE
jgi:hypothetical protein